MSEDYSDLLDKEFVVVQSDGTTIPAKLVGIDFDIGITIIRQDDPDDYLACLVSDTVEPRTEMEEKALYKPMFDMIVEGIKDGKVYFKTIKEFVSRKSSLHTGNSPSSETCAFNR